MSWDILVLGATGQTGFATTRCLAQHAEFKSGKFTLCVAGRSEAKLQKAVKDLDLPKHISTIQVDVSNHDAVDDAVKRTKKVIINTVGPYWLYGTPVVAACAKYGVHYVDLTAETHWIKRMIAQYDYLATKTHAIIIPSCGYDSIPSDLSLYLGAKKLAEAEGDKFAGVESSTTAFKQDGHVSLGTFSSFASFFNDVDRTEQKEATADYSTSPAIGLPPPAYQPVYSLKTSADEIISGAIWAMAPLNSHVVQRTWGLSKLDRRRKASDFPVYGDGLRYSEFMVCPNPFVSVMTSFILMNIALWLIISPTRKILMSLATKYLHVPTDEKELLKGWFKTTNITTSTNGLHARTVISAQGDPGYYATCHMLAESAIALALSHDSLPDLAKQGGILTPMTGLGDVLIERLRGNKLFNVECEIVDLHKSESKKHV